MGLDGVPWELLNALMSRGRMPTLASFLPQARTGILQSTIPPSTGPSWTTFATGKNPGKHGIFGLFRYGESFMPRPVQSTDIQGKTLYEIISDAGLRSVLVNLPVSYPPRDFNGVVVGDLLSPRPYIHPPTLQDLLDGYRVFYNFSLEGMALAEDILDVERRRMAVARKLFDSQAWDLFFVLFSGTDWLSHFYYATLLEEDSPVGRKAAILFRDIDNLLCEWIGKLPPESHCLLLSDHGFQRCSHSFDLNSWLEAQRWAMKRPKTPGGGRQNPEGHLLVKPSGDEVVIPESLLLIARRLHWARTIFVRVLQAFGREVKFDSPYELDLDKSAAFAPRGSMYGLYVNRRVVPEPQAREKLVSDIVSGLRNLRMPSDESPAFALVEERTAVYGNEIPVNHAPDVICIPSPGLCLDVSLLHGPTIVPRDTSRHSQDGFIVLRSPALPPGDLGQVDMCDITPTILALLGLPVAPDMDGKVLLGNVGTKGEVKTNSVAPGSPGRPQRKGQPDPMA